MRHVAPALALGLLALLPHGARAQDPEPAPPESPRGLVRNDEGAYRGYTLFPPLRSTTTYLVDMDGKVVHEWESEHSPGNSAYLFDDGRMIRCARMQNPVFSGGGQGGRIQELQWDGTITWDFAFSDETKLHHHDVEPLPNGNLLLIAWERMTQDEAVAAGRDPEQVGESGLWPDYLVEIEPVRPDGGKVVWEWHVKDHLIQDFDRTQAGFGDVTAHPGRVDVNLDHRREPPMSEVERRRQAEIEKEMRALGYTGDDDDEDERATDRPDREGGRRRRGGDWMHTNSVDYLAEYDLIALSVHNFHEVWILDHSTTTEEARGSRGGRYGRGGEILYRWGNPQTYGHGERRDQQLFGQHDATFVPGPVGPGDAGGKAAVHLLVFNNGQGRSGKEYSSVDEIALPFDPARGFLRAAGEAFGPAAPVWSYSDAEGGFFSSFISGAQRLPNGNTLIISGAQGRIFEVTRDERVVWDYLNPFGGETPLMADGGQHDSPPDGPPDGPRGGPDRRPDDDRRGERGPPPDGDRPPRRGGGMIPKGLFRAERIPHDHPALKSRGL